MRKLINTIAKKISAVNKEEIIKSGLLEQYASGLLSAEMEQEMEGYFKKWPELRRHVAEMQDMLNEVGKEYDLLDAAEHPFRARVVKMHQSAKSPPATAVNPFLRVATLVLLIGLAATAAYFYQKNSIADAQLATLNERLTELQRDLDSNQINLQQLLENHNFFVHPHTARVHLRPLTPDNFMGDAIAYYNPTAEQAFLKVVNIPPLSADHHYQIWADVQGKMVYMGQIQPQTEDFVDIPFIPDAESLNITIEPATGSQQPTVEQLVMQGEIEL